MSITSSTASLPQRDSIRGAPPAGERAFSIAFSAMLALGLFVALGGLAAILIWAISAGLPRLDWGLLTNAPSTARI